MTIALLLIGMFFGSGLIGCVVLAQLWSHRAVDREARFQSDQQKASDADLSRWIGRQGVLR